MSAPAVFCGPCASKGRKIVPIVPDSHAFAGRRVSASSVSAVAAQQGPKVSAGKVLPPVTVSRGDFRDARDVQIYIANWLECKRALSLCGMKLLQLGKILKKLRLQLYLFDAGVFTVADLAAGGMYTNLSLQKNRVIGNMRLFEGLVKRHNKHVERARKLFMGNILPVDLGFYPKVIINTLAPIFRCSLCEQFLDIDARSCSCGVDLIVPSNLVQAQGLLSGLYRSTLHDIETLSYLLGERTN